LRTALYVAAAAPLLAVLLAVQLPSGRERGRLEAATEVGLLP
jgi:hypothetical protein